MTILFRTVFRTVRRAFYVDLRSLAAFRVGLAAMLLVDLYYRSQQLKVLFTDRGFLPKEALVEAYGSSMRWTSLHFYTGSSVLLQGAMLALAGVVAVALLVGYRTWTATLVSWILFVSLNRRIPASCYGFDDVTRLLLVWSLFLPLGARWSLDSRRAIKSYPSNQYFSVGTVGILLQVCYIYWCTAIWKLHPDWLEGRAIQYAFQLDYSTRALGEWLAPQRAITVPATYLTLALEFLVPFLAISPWKTATCRWLAIAAMWGMHVGIWLCISIGLFPPIAIVYWIMFIPSSTWDVVAQRRTREEAVVENGTRGGWHSDQTKPLVDILALLLILQITIYNVLEFPQVTKAGLRMPFAFARVTQLMRIDQKWRLYAPTPNIPDAWLIMPAVLKDGSTFDIWLNKPVSYEKPRPVASTFPDFRVIMFFFISRADHDSPVWPWVARYMAREWNAEHLDDSQVERVQLIFVGELGHNMETYLDPKVEYDAQLDRAVPLSPNPIGKAQPTP